MQNIKDIIQFIKNQRVTGYEIAKKTNLTEARLRYILERLGIIGWMIGVVICKKAPHVYDALLSNLI